MRRLKDVLSDILNVSHKMGPFKYLSPFSFRLTRPSNKTMELTFDSLMISRSIGVLKIKLGGVYYLLPIVWMIHKKSTI